MSELESNDNGSPQSLAGATSAYALRRKQHLDLIKQLRAIGAQADLDLPRIVVIGNQSAGKSSLVEAISGINVPRDAGTCTRCPIECRLASSSEDWSCQVYIRWEFESDGRRREEVVEDKFGPLITNKVDVELALRRAQCAVLNPNHATKRFLRVSAEDIKTIQNKLAFSQNTVCLDLYGPDLTDLAFVDLPGIVQNADDQTVQMVENLVKSHISGRCLILVTLPMSDDIENQKAARLAHEADPSGQRTIGVLTKPDTLTAGALSSKELWLDVIEGRRHRKTHGYFCTRQPDDAERSNGITASQARAVEKAFFDTMAPWSTSNHRQRFGTDNLIQNLSRILSGLIDAALPTLQAEVSKQLATCSDELSKLPAPITSDPSTFVLNLVLSFCQDVEMYVRGSVSSSDLVQANRRTYAQFKRDIRDSALLFLPYVNAAEQPDTDEHRRFFRFEDDEVTNITEYAGETVGRPRADCLYLSDVRKHISDAVTRELPDNVPYAVKVALIRQSQNSWPALSASCFKEVQDAFNKKIQQLIKNHFARYRQLKTRVKKLVKELITKCDDATSIRMSQFLEYEEVPYTQNEHYLQETKAKYLSTYKDARSGKLKLVLTPKSKRAKQAPDTEADKPAQMFVFGASTSAAPAVDSPPRPTKKLRTNESAKPQPAKVASSSNKQHPISVDDSSSGEGPSDSESSSDEGESDEAEGKKREQAAGTERTTVKATAVKRPLDADERTEVENQALSLLSQLGYHVTAADFGKLNPPDIYEREMQLMAEVRAYFQISYKRIIDDIPRAIDHAFLYAFSKALRAFLVEQLQLGTLNAGARCASYLAEDPRIVDSRDELTAKKRRLEAVQGELYNFGF